MNARSDIRGKTTERGGRPRLSRLLILQAVYCVLGIGYNAISLLLIRTVGHPLSPTDPVMGMVVMAAYGACLVTGLLDYLTIYRVLMGLCVFVLGWGGVVTHIINAFGRLFLYDSTLAWGSAVGINLFGLVLNVLAASGFFARNGRRR